MSAYKTPKKQLKVAVGTWHPGLTEDGKNYRRIYAPGLVNFIQDLEGHEKQGLPVLTSPGPFYAVLEFKTVTFLRRGFYVRWTPRTPVLDDTVTEVPMIDHAFVECVRKKDWVGVGLLDGKWEFRKHGSNLTLWPLFE